MGKYSKAVLESLSADDFEEVDDYIIDAECNDCGHVNDYATDDTTECVECGSDNLLFHDAHEGEPCHTCSHTYEQGESNFHYIGDEKTFQDMVICKHCHDTLRV